MSPAEVTAALAPDSLAVLTFLAQGGPAVADVREGLRRPPFRRRT